MKNVLQYYYCSSPIPSHGFNIILRLHKQAIISVTNYNNNNYGYIISLCHSCMKIAYS